MLRPALPNVNGGGCANASVRNQRSTVRSSLGRLGSPTRFGRLPAPTPMLVVSRPAFGVTGEPLSSVKMPPSRQLPTIASR
jgi:hypothetical protein